MHSGPDQPRIQSEVLGTLLRSSRVYGLVSILDHSASPAKAEAKIPWSPFFAIQISYKSGEIDDGDNAGDDDDDDDEHDDDDDGHGEEHDDDDDDGDGDYE